jgi:hypothetical protein
LDGGGVIGERGRFSIIGGGGGGGGGGITFLGIFFKLLIKTVACVLFDEVALGDVSCLTGILNGDLLMVDIGSNLVDVFCDVLLLIMPCDFLTDAGGVAFGGESTGSFFFVMAVVDGFMS